MCVMTLCGYNSGIQEHLSNYFKSHFRMPLEKNGRPWVLAEFPDEIEEDDAIFRIRFTGEVCSVGTRWHGLQSSCVTSLIIHKQGGGGGGTEGTCCNVV